MELATGTGIDKNKGYEPLSGQLQLKKNFVFLAMLSCSCAVADNCIYHRHEAIYAFEKVAECALSTGHYL